MANSTCMGFCNKGLLVYLIAFFFTAQILMSSRVVSMEFQVGGTKGWVIPPSKDDQLYNEWASNNRFNVNDTLHFGYKKDSVMVVTKEEYEKCRSGHPSFFSNNGNTAFTFDRSGLFYFISGVSGHCERGMKMIIKVLETDQNHNQSANQTSNNSTSSSHSLHRIGTDHATISPSTLVTILISFFGALFL